MTRQRAGAEKSLNVAYVGLRVPRESRQDRGPCVRCLCLMRFFKKMKKWKKREGHLILHPLCVLVSFKRWT